MLKLSVGIWASFINICVRKNTRKHWFEVLYGISWCNPCKSCKHIHRVSRCLFTRLSLPSSCSLSMCLFIFISDSFPSLSPSFSHLSCASSCSCNCLSHVPSCFLSQSPASSCNSSCLTLLFSLSECEAGHLLSCNEAMKALLIFLMIDLLFCTLSFIIVDGHEDEHERCYFEILVFLVFSIFVFCGVFTKITCEIKSLEFVSYLDYYIKHAVM